MTGITCIAVGKFARDGELGHRRRRTFVASGWHYLPGAEPGIGTSTHRWRLRPADAMCMFGRNSVAPTAGTNNFVVPRCYDFIRRRNQATAVVPRIEWRIVQRNRRVVGAESPVGGAGP